MSTEPTIVERPAQPYVAIRKVVTMDTIPEIADRLPAVFGWLAARGIAPAGPPFLKYNRLDMGGELEVEAGVPVPAPATGEGEVLAATLPAGRYATVTHLGPFDQLVGVTGALLDWAAEQGLTWATTDDGRWAARLELYLTDPREEPDPARWRTDLAFQLA